MKKVTVKMNSEKNVSGYLLDARNVMMINDGMLKIVGVELRDLNYVRDNKSFIVLGKVAEGINEELLIKSVTNRLQNTTMYDYLLGQWDRSEDISFDLIN
ncbi:hypothetical protein [Fictibacillus sp. JL2B1089]|uniref:hypothetical protein n=1 Tax=Fictibacillus sp. JL2B1089 TaxID=3399565 RepID=UPI003A842721